jgi:hypothetical protein
MTQTQIVQTLADSCEVTKKVAKNLLDTLAQAAVTVKCCGLLKGPRATGSTFYGYHRG